MTGEGPAGTVVGLVLGAGVLCLWWSWWDPGPRRERSGGRWTRVVGDLRAGFAAWEVRPGPLLAGSLGAGGLTFVAMLAVSGIPVVAGCFAVLAACGPVTLVRARAGRRRERLRELWPDVVDHLGSAVRAGLSLPEALSQLGEHGPEPLRPAFVAFGRDLQASGRFGESLDTLKDRLADPVADRVCEALRVTRDVGGSDVGQLLRGLATHLRRDCRTRGELLARQGWTVGAARLAAVAPWLVLALLSTRPEAVVAYRRPAGAGVLLVGAGVTVVAYRLMLRIGRLPEDRRVLR